MKNNFNDNVFNNNHPKTLENMYCDAMRDNIRRCNPGKTDEELGIDKPRPFQVLCKQKKLI